MINSWKRHAEGKASADIDIVANVGEMTLEIISTSAFGPAFLDDHSMVGIFRQDLAVKGEVRVQKGDVVFHPGPGLEMD